MAPATQTARKRNEEGAHSTPADTTALKKPKPAAGTPGVVTPLPQMGGAKKRSLAAGLDPARPTADRRSSSAPRARTANAADALAGLANTSMSMGAFEEEQMKDQAERTRRVHNPNRPPAKLNAPDAAADGGTKKSKSSGKPVDTTDKSEKPQSKPNKKSKPPPASDSDKNTTESDSLDSDDGEEGPDPTVNQPQI